MKVDSENPIAVLREARRILRVPETHSITDHAAKIMGGIFDVDEVLDFCETYPDVRTWLDKLLGVRNDPIIDPWWLKRLREPFAFVDRS